ncbi:hypothetical protein SACE_2449 [Saccharopolyspora erythraea NRRL 2338]|uniref:Nitroreductase domain-containing protein n=1 Tax=Saccharopolyspora erythraea (strain ATCC 11635 / DSM 40517 / JCM 4748 / NBRC 13426 / NCIMB 8594 / NRRL 2338) TaxID=405948 RepID=A4FCH2_SACEN|nr:hypothetical protein SACE_2449 [Saccharopolyspora erythraea NRRL 2338]
MQRAVRCAPSVHNTRPWSLEVHGHRAVLSRRTDQQLDRHDITGRDQLISCGAALTNLELAVREIGWAATAEPGDSPEVIGVIRGDDRAEPTDLERARYAAIARRTSDRRPFAPQPLTEEVRAHLRDAAGVPPVHAQWVHGQQKALLLARSLHFAARAYHDDREYQRELAMWTVAPGMTGDLGLRHEALGARGVPAVGLVTSTTHLPDESRLASWIAAESVLVLSAPGDRHRAAVRTGQAMQTAWLDATSAGLAASVMTQPLHLPEVAHALRRQLELSGEPMVIMRFGHPAEPEDPPD